LRARDVRNCKRVNPALSLYGRQAIVLGLDVDEFDNVVRRSGKPAALIGLAPTSEDTQKSQV
jgi:hypothetical protein